MQVRCGVKLFVQLGFQALLITIRMLLVLASLRVHLYLKTRSMKKEFLKSMTKSGVSSDFALELRGIYENHLKEEVNALSFRRALKNIAKNM